MKARTRAAGRWLALREADSSASFFIRALTPALLILLGCASAAQAGTTIGFGTGVPITNGIKDVNFNFDKGFRFQVAGCKVGLLELRLGLTNSTTKRISVMYVGSTALRTPLTVEAAEISCALLVALALATTATLLWRTLGAGPPESDTSPSGHPVRPP